MAASDRKTPTSPAESKQASPQPYEAPDSAILLQEGVSMMLLQREREVRLSQRNNALREQGRERQKESPDLSGSPHPLQNIASPHSATRDPEFAYGYDGYNGEGLKFKQEIDKLRKDLKPGGQDGGGEAPVSKWLTDLENAVKEAQNNWMKGAPVDTNALKEKINKLKEEAQTIDFGGQEKRERALDFINKFPEEIDKEVNRLRMIVQDCVHTQQSKLTRMEMSEQYMRFAIEQAMQEQKSSCDVLKITQGDLDRLARKQFESSEGESKTAETVATEVELDDLSPTPRRDQVQEQDQDQARIAASLHNEMNGSSNHAYVLVEGEERGSINSVYYLNYLQRKFVKVDVEGSPEEQKQILESIASTYESVEPVHVDPQGNIEGNKRGRLLSESERMQIEDSLNHYPQKIDSNRSAQWHDPIVMVRAQKWSLFYSASKLMEGKGWWWELEAESQKDLKASDWKQTIPYVIDGDIGTKNKYSLAAMSKNLQTNVIELHCKGDEGLEYRVLGLDGAEKKAIIPWDKLPANFPRTDDGILNNKKELISKILDNTSQAGHTPKNEIEMREKDQKDYTEQYNSKELGAIMARDAALQRLYDAQKSRENQGVSYRYGNDEGKYHVSRKKGEDGKFVFSVQYQPSWQSLWHNDYAKGMAALVNLCYTQDPFHLVRLDCGKLEFPRDQDAAKEIVKQLKHAVEAVEAAAEKGIYIGLELGENALAALEALNYPDNLQARVENSRDTWREKVLNPHKEEQAKANERYHAEETKLGTLLATPPAQGGEEKLLKEAFQTQDSNEDTLEQKERKKGERLAELTTAVEKLKGKVARAESLMRDSIPREIDKLTQELDQEYENIQETDDDLYAKADRLKEMSAQLVMFREAQTSAEAEMNAIVGDKKVVENYRAWIEQDAMGELVGFKNSIALPSANSSVASSSAVSSASSSSSVSSSSSSSPSTMDDGGSSQPLPATPAAEERKELQGDSRLQQKENLLTTLHNIKQHAQAAVDAQTVPGKRRKLANASSQDGEAVSHDNRDEQKESPQKNKQNNLSRIKDLEKRINDRSQEVALKQANRRAAEEAKAAQEQEGLDETGTPQQRMNNR